MHLKDQIMIATMLALWAGLAISSRLTLLPPIPLWSDAEPRRPKLMRSISSDVEPGRPKLMRSASSTALNTSDHDRLLDVLSHARLLESWEREPRQWFLGRLRDPSKEA